ncbi:MAG: DJ-1/PfpI family protein, partial [Chloroflexi bacterium]|nr:DJ-1/PfpI family protein [Chloroflexota bacterium]
MQQQDTLQGVRVAILVNDDFEQVEMTEPRKALDQAGAETVLISPVQGEIHGMKHDVRADSFRVELSIDQANPDGFDALMIPGGALNADYLRMNEKAREFVRSFDSLGKPIA